MTHPIKALCEKALAEFKHDPHAHYVEGLAAECLKLLEVVEYATTLRDACCECVRDHYDNAEQIKEALSKGNQITNGEPK